MELPAPIPGPATMTPDAGRRTPDAGRRTGPLDPGPGFGGGATTA